MTIPAMNVAVLIDRQARSSPERVAIVADRAWTYAEVRQRMLDFAAGIAALDLPAGSTIAVLVPRDGDLVPLLLAILWSGHAYLPIDPDEPSPRAARMIEIAGSSAIVCPRAVHRELAKAGAGIRHIDPKALGRRGAGAAPSFVGGKDAPAYVIFTSGSTGEPKGVEVSHAAVINLLDAMRELLGVSPGDRLLATTTIAFDIAVLELFLPLSIGASVLLRDRTLLMDPAALRDEIERHGVTCVQLGPSAWSVILSLDMAFPQIRTAITGGEPIAPALARKLAQVATEAWNLYGPTEATVWATAHRLRENEPAGLSTISAPIGRPLANYRLLVIDGSGRVVDDDTEGELLIGGAGLANGYTGRPDLTAERFIDLPEHGGRYYRTGDLVRRDASGIFHYLGRNDDQIKIRGIRIEPREIESALLALPEIRHAAATWYMTAAGNRAIAAGIVWKDGERLTPEHLRGRLERSLPAAMAPSRFVTFDTLPLTRSGKIDRGAIRAEATKPAVQSQPGYYRSLILTDTQARLAMIWARTLEVPTVELDDNFFESGGDSLSAITMLLDVEKLFDVRLTAQDVWNAPTLVALAKLIDRSRVQPDDIANRETVYPMVQGGSGAPVFFNGANTKLTRPGVWRLDCPLYGMSQWAHGEGFIRANSIEEVAARQIADIRKVQPGGPYRIAGFSLGGLIALEIAQQLRAVGEDVEMLFLLDPMMPVQYSLRREAAVEKAPGYARRPVALRVRDHLKAIARNPRRQIPYVWSRVLGESPAWQRACFELVDLHGRHPGWMTRALLPKDRWPAFWYAAGRLAGKYVANPYDGPAIAVFHRTEERFRLWSELLTGEAQFRIIETSHLGMFIEPAMTSWIELLGETLERETGMRGAIEPVSGTAQRSFASPL